MSTPIDITRTASDLEHENTLVLPEVKVRFQLAPGTGPDLGIEGAEYVVLVDGVEVARGTTTAEGEVSLPLRLVADASVSVRIFDTDFVFELHGELEGPDALRGQQTRLDALGYITGYQLSAIESDTADDGTDGPRTQQSILNFQADHDLSIDGDIGPRTRRALVDLIGE